MKETSKIQTVITILIGSSFNYRLKRSFGQGNIFTGVCDSVHKEGCLVPGEGSSKFSGWGSSKFSGGGLHRNTVNVRPVRILLECILVLCKFCKFSRTFHLTVVAVLT